MITLLPCAVLGPSAARRVNERHPVRRVAHASSAQNVAVLVVAPVRTVRTHRFAICERSPVVRNSWPAHSSRAEGTFVGEATQVTGQAIYRRPGGREKCDVGPQSGLLNLDPTPSRDRPRCNARICIGLRSSQPFRSSTRQPLLSASFKPLGRTSALPYTISTARRGRPR